MDVVFLIGSQMAARNLFEDRKFASNKYDLLPQETSSVFLVPVIIILFYIRNQKAHRKP